MVILLILLLLIAAGCIGYLIREASQPSPPPPRDPEVELKAAIELYRIRRRLDASWTKTEQRAGAYALRRQISEAFEEDDGK